MLKRLMMLSLASLALVLGLRAMVRTDQALTPPPSSVRCVVAAVPALPTQPPEPETDRALHTGRAVHVPVCGLCMLPLADANGLPVAGLPYYRTAYSVFHLSDTAG